MDNSTIFSVRNALPAYYAEEYPQFVAFLEHYFEWLRSEEGIGDVILKLRQARDIDSGFASLLSALRSEYGPDFVQLQTMPDGLALRVYETWYRSKGTKEAIEAYFRLFLNVEAKVEFPRENILRIDGGNWSEAESRYLNDAGKIDEVTMVLQDDFFYQAFSYLVKTGISIIDWGDAFKKVAHPTGWIFFGQVDINSLAKFRFNGLSPSIVPGRQFLSKVVLIDGFAAFSRVTTTRNIVKTWANVPALGTRPLRYNEIGNNIGLSTFRVTDLEGITVDQLSSSELSSIYQRPARVDIS
jgi:hypothetical protein